MVLRVTEEEFAIYSKHTDPQDAPALDRHGFQKTRWGTPRKKGAHIPRIRKLAKPKRQKLINGPDLPTEHQMQATVFAWIDRQKKQYPALEWIYAVPNGQYKSREVRGIFRDEGLRGGVPDICVAVPQRHPQFPDLYRYCGLYIEMKRGGGGTVSKTQNRWLTGLNEQGYLAVVARSGDQAMVIIATYLGLPTAALPAGLAIAPDALTPPARR